MSAFDSITKLLRPTVLDSLKGTIAPVKCKIWSGIDEKSFEDITIKDLYPFDTLETLKSMIAFEQVKIEQQKFMPHYTFVGIEKNSFLEPPQRYSVA